jgi:kynurenine formamidase
LAIAFYIHKFGDMIDPSRYNIIDLTMTFQEGVAGYHYDVSKTVEKDGWNARTLFLYSHAGTHMDAPFHFGISDDYIDEIAIKELVGKAWVVSIPIRMDNQLIDIQDLQVIADRLEEGDSLLLRTDWSHNIHLQKKYRNKLPRISEKLANWCVDKRIKMLGVEPPSVADVNNLQEVTLIHQILLGGGIIIIEGLINLDKITREEVFLMAFPLKIKGGDGAPARVVAFEEKSLDDE